METYFVQIRYAQKSQDYYIDASSIEEACDKAAYQYALEHNIHESHFGFINAVA